MSKPKILEKKEIERPTLGSLLVKNHEENAGRLSQTIRETTNEMGKEYIKSLDRIIYEHEHYSEPYYIMEIISPEYHMEGVIRMRHIARKTRPKPEWGIALYRVDNKKGEITYEWGLPFQHEATMVMTNPEGWDPKIVKDIRDYVEGTLV